MALSIRLLNWTVPSGLLQACMVLEGMSTDSDAHTITHTHTHRDKRPSLAFCLSRHCRHSDFPCRLTYVIVEPTKCLLAPDGRFLIACLLSVCVHVVHACAYLCAVMIILSKKKKKNRTSNHFWTFGRKGCFQPNVHPLSSWIYSFACVNGCIDEKPPPLIHTHWVICMIVTL